jgi:hypothetical protein
LLSTSLALSGGRGPCVLGYAPRKSNMDAGDCIFLAQTIIVFLTGVIVLYYARETHKLRKSSERQIRIAAKTGLLAAYMQNLTLIEARNIAWASQGKVTREDTTEVAQQINTLEAEINQLISESD